MIELMLKNEVTNANGSKYYPHIDFPLDNIKFYYENGVLLLPSER